MEKTRGNRGRGRANGDARVNDIAKRKKKKVQHEGVQMHGRRRECAAERAAVASPPSLQFRASPTPRVRTSRRAPVCVHNTPTRRALCSDGRPAIQSAGRALDPERARAAPRRFTPRHFTSRRTVSHAGQPDRRPPRPGPSAMDFPFPPPRRAASPPFPRCPRHTPVPYPPRSCPASPFSSPA